MLEADQKPYVGELKWQRDRIKATIKAKKKLSRNYRQKKNKIRKKKKVRKLTKIKGPLYEGLFVSA